MAVTRGSGLGLPSISTVRIDHLSDAPVFQYVVHDATHGRHGCAAFDVRWVAIAHKAKPDSIAQAEASVQPGGINTSGNSGEGAGREDSDALARSRCCQPVKIHVETDSEGKPAVWEGETDTPIELVGEHGCKCLPPFSVKPHDLSSVAAQLPGVDQFGDSTLAR